MSMCVRRLELAPIDRDVKFWEQHAFVDDIDTAEAELTAQSVEAERDLRVSVGRLTFLSELVAQGEEVPCPICLERIAGSRAMLPCGHSLCPECLRQMLSIRGPV